jgi:hypothetical protein
VFSIGIGLFWISFPGLVEKILKVNSNLQIDEVYNVLGSIFDSHKVPG